MRHEITEREKRKKWPKRKKVEEKNKAQYTVKSIYKPDKRKPADKCPDSGEKRNESRTVLMAGRSSLPRGRSVALMAGHTTRNARR